MHVWKKIAIFFVLLILSLSGCLELRFAYIPDNFLGGGWHEDIESSERGSNYFGLEKWKTVVYKNGDTATLTVTTIKTLIMIDREGLLERVDSDIRNNCNEQGITLTSKVLGYRTLANGHKTKYIIYNGTKGIDKYKIIGEVWSCSHSGVSVICMGLAKVSDANGLSSWREMVGDPSGSIEGVKNEKGLIFNVNCH